MSHRYCGRDFSEHEITEIRRLIAEDPGRTRAELSRLSCRVLQWYKADGGLKDMSARVAMLRMQTDGLITLPPPRHKPPDATVSITSQTDPGPPLRRPARALTPLRLQRVQQRQDSRLWNEYIQRYHYLGHKPLPGAQIRYIIFSEAQPIALLGFGAAAWQTAPRDRYIGWSHDQRKRNLPLIVNNARFLILPWVQSKIWLPCYWQRWPKRFPGIGRRSMVIAPSCWKPLSRNHASRVPATRRPIGSTWVKPKAVVNWDRLENRAFRSRTYGFIPWINASGRC